MSDLVKVPMKIFSGNGSAGIGVSVPRRCRRPVFGRRAWTQHQVTPLKKILCLIE
jgi:hypothetical protein